METPRVLAQRIAALHPPVDAEIVHTKGKVILMGKWNATACPQWIEEIAALIATRDEARDASGERDA